MSEKLVNFALAGVVSTAAALLLAGAYLCYTSTLDTATVGLMSVNILQGDRPLFFYGQTYLGALEAYLAAFYISLFGFSEFVVSLSPISFTLGWILCTYLLFARLHSRATGLIAATCTAFPGYYVFWYSIGTYGYSVLACVGTAILWLSLRMVQEDSRNLTLVLQGLLLGVLAAVGIWTHALTFPFIAVAACMLGVFTVRQRFRGDIVITVSLACLTALTGFLPFYFETGSFFKEFSSRTTLSVDYVSQALSTLFSTNIYELMVWNFRYIFKSRIIQYCIEYGGVAILVPAGILGLHALIFSRSEKNRFLWLLVPGLYSLFFLLMYVQHQMATLAAPRYVICFYTMLLCVIWSAAVVVQSRRVLKIIAMVLFLGWVGFQVTGTVIFIIRNIEGTRNEQQLMREVVDAAGQRGLKSVITYGDHRLGYKAQKLSMYAGNTIVFANSGGERYLANAEVAEIDLHKGYLTNAAYKAPLENSLQSLGVTCTVEQVGTYYLFSELQLKTQYSMREIGNAHVRVRYLPQGDGWTSMGHLGDLNGNNGQGLQPIAGESITFDLGASRPVCGLWLFSEQGRHATRSPGFGHFEVYVSEDDVSYSRVFESRLETANVYHSGPQVFIGGRLGKGEAVFKPVYSRYVKMYFSRKALSPITEILIFESDGTLRAGESNDVKAIAEQVQTYDVDFVYADRWISANLLAELKGSAKEHIAIPRHSTKYKENRTQYVLKPGQGQAMVCDAAVADSCEEIVIREYGQKVIGRRINFRNYVLFIFAEPEKPDSAAERAALLWNGHLPLRTPDLMQFIETKGVYPDSWTNGKGLYYGLDYTLDHNRHQELILHTYGWRPFNDELESLNLRVVANNTISLPFKGSRKNTYVFALPADLERLDSLAVTSTTFVPVSQDNRKLGLDIQRIEIR